MQSRTIPLLSLFAAFSFVLMMFNLPLPGGTTGHAVGVGIAAIVLGPAAATIAISLSLLVQALLFGDGGITTYGANCFNMAIVGSFVSYAVYRGIAWKSDVLSKRRVVAAGLAGYVAINAAAICAAVEFGIQPFLFHDPSGSPLYAPYPLHIALPAMMIGHLTIAGVAEFAVAAGLVRYLQQSDPSLLQADRAGTRKPLRGLWAVLVTLLVLSPLGIIAAGSAWGEWSTADFEDSSARREIAAASQNSSLPPNVPAGLRKWSETWAAPIAAYAPAFIRSRSAGYTFSAAVGVSSIVVIAIGIGQFLPRKRRGIVERTLDTLIDTTERVFFVEQSWAKPGVLQRLDARVKLVSFLVLILAATASSSLSMLALLLVAGVLLAPISDIAIRPALTRLWLAACLFTGLLALPALFLTPGRELAAWPALHLSASLEGCRAAGFLLLRSLIAITFGSLLILTTPWNQLLRALRFLHVPSAIVASLGMTYRYAFLFVQSSRQMLEARQSRSVGTISGAEQRRVTSTTMGALLDKVFYLSGEVRLAMLARGFRGEIRILEEPALRPAERMQLITVIAVAAAFLWVGHLL